MPRVGQYKCFVSEEFGAWEVSVTLLREEPILRERQQIKGEVKLVK